MHPAPTTAHQHQHRQAVACAPVAAEPRAWPAGATWPPPPLPNPPPRAPPAAKEERAQGVAGRGRAQRQKIRGVVDGRRPTGPHSHHHPLQTAPAAAYRTGLLCTALYRTVPHRTTLFRSTPTCRGMGDASTSAITALMRLLEAKVATWRPPWPSNTPKAAKEACPAAQAQHGGGGGL